MDKATVEKAVDAAHTVLEKGNRVVLIPTKDGIWVKEDAQKTIAKITDGGGRNG